MVDGRIRIGVVLPIAQVETDGQATPYAVRRSYDRILALKQAYG